MCAHTATHMRNESMVKQWKKAVEEWRRHFARDLNDGGSSDVQGERELSIDEIELFDEEITREEVEQKTAPGSNGLTAEIVSSKKLVDLWLCLFIWPVLDIWNGTLGIEKKCMYLYQIKEEVGCARWMNFKE